jgi:Anti-sigma-D factor RsdA to sigma factor binding region
MRDRKNRGNGGPSPRPGRSDQGPHDMSDGYDWGQDGRLDLADLAAVRADDDLIDALAFGHPRGVHVQHERGVEDGPAGFTDDQAVLALLGSWRRDIESDAFPDLCTVEEAAKAIAAGQRATRPRRRLMPVATAAAVAVLALAGVGVAAGHATPGSPLWGLSTLLDGQRAQSVEATETVSVVLASVQQALAEGKVLEAKAALAKVAPELKQIRDQHSKQQLSLKIQNLQDTANYTPEGESVPTDPDGVPTDHRHPVWPLLRGRGEGGRGPSGTSGRQGAGSSSSYPSGAGPSSDNGRGTGTDLRGASSAGSAPSTPSSDARPPQDTSGSPQSPPSEGGQSPSGGGQSPPSEGGHSPSGGGQSPPSEGGHSPSGGGQSPPGPDVKPNSGDTRPTTPPEPPVRHTHPAKPTKENDSSRDSAGHSTSDDRSGKSGDRGNKSNDGGSDRHHGGEHHSEGKSEGGPDSVGPAGAQQQFGSLRPVSR